MSRLAVVATTADPSALLPLIESCLQAAAAGATVRVFFRDESIPAICRSEVSETALAFGSDAGVHTALTDLAATGDTRLYACSSSLYVWGVGPEDLIPAIAGPRGLIAFLADDLAGAERIVSC